MKNLIAYFLMVATLVTGSVTFASAQKPQSNGIGKAADATTEAANSAPRYFTVSGSMTRYHTYRMNKGENARIVLDGDGDTDLDLYVYDGNGNLIDSATGYGDYEVSNTNWFVNTTITVKVVNRGSVYNTYDLSVWIS